MFADAGYELPPVHVSVGFPSRCALARRKQRIGECWHPKCSTSGHSQIFITPLLADGVRVAGVLVHELIHAVLPEAGHRGPFVKAMRALGLEGKPTATTESPALVERLNALVEQAGPYPHAALTAISKDKKQTTRLLRVQCEDCGYTARVTRQWLDDEGAPLCPCNKQPMEES
jgi:hypothetical protein